MDRARSTACYLAMDGWSFSSLGSGVVALEGVDTEAPSAGAGGADGAASLAGAFVLVAWWRGGVVAWWRGGAVVRWRGGLVA